MRINLPVNIFSMEYRYDFFTQVSLNLGLHNSNKLGLSRAKLSSVDTNPVRRALFRSGSKSGFDLLTKNL
jgi:hypothetical protein